MNLPRFGFLLFYAAATTAHAAPEARFRAVQVDGRISIGYGVTVADVDGDARPDILLADQKQFVWYRNPGWEKHVLAENLTVADNVCIAARDVDGDGKAEIAVGAGWNPGDTTGSGALFYLMPPADRTQRWRPVQMPHEPTVHRMHWVRDASGAYHLAVLPLHGRGNQNGQGAGVRFLAHAFSSEPADRWPIREIDTSLHVTHNFDVQPRAEGGYALIMAAREGLFRFEPHGTSWRRTDLVGTDTPGFAGAGEVRAGRGLAGSEFLASIEPFHGHQLVLYVPGKHTNRESSLTRRVLDDTLKEGHALACADLLGLGTDQIVVGWRNQNAQRKTGIKLFAPVHGVDGVWSSVAIDGNEMACEDLYVADLDNDGRLDIVASGRATRNVKIYFNETMQSGSAKSGDK